MRFVRRERMGPREAGVIRALRGERKSGFLLRSGRNCNLSCRHCYTDSGPSKTLVARPETAALVLKNLKPLAEKGKVGFLGINGGEPMLNPKFVAEVVSMANGTFWGMGAEAPKAVVVTNGTICNDFILRSLRPLNDRIMLFYSHDQFHPKPARMPEYEKIGIETIERRDDYEIAGIGRGFRLEGDVRWKTSCDAARVRYVVSGEHVIADKRSMARHIMAITESGGLHLCDLGGFVFGDLTRQDTFEIAEDLAWSERAMEFVTNGPIGLAALEGNEREAIEIFLERGSCGVCHALVEGII